MTVRSSTAVPAPASMYEARLPTDRRSRVATTSAAVNGVPSCHFTPERSLNVHSLPSSLGDQDSASIGAIAAPSPLPQRYSKAVVAMV